MLDEFGIAKIGDFGYAEIFTDDNDMLKNTNGTYLFLAPECRDRTYKSHIIIYSKCEIIFR
jgi:serine/threonine protein kinase